MLEIPHWVKNRFPAERRAAVDFFRLRIDDSMLREIAEADYGNEAAQHWNALVPLRNGEDWNELDLWYPMEVLELRRWSEPDLEYASGADRLRGHEIRAFCCAALLATSNFEPDHTTLAKGLDSAFAIGTGAVAAMAKFLMWKIPLLGAYDNNPFYALALTIAVLDESPNLSLENETLLVDWLAMIEGNYEDSPRLLCLASGSLKEWNPLIAKIHHDWPDRPLSDYLHELGID